MIESRVPRFWPNLPEVGISGGASLNENTTPSVILDTSLTRRGCQNVFMASDVHTDFDALTRQHKDAVYRQMLRVCGNQQDAEDVLVEALLKA